MTQGIGRALEPSNPDEFPAVAFDCCGSVAVPRRGVYRRWGKRMIDVLLSGALLVATSPLQAVISVVVRRDGGPALYRALRSGKGGGTFEMLKFRTMVVNADRLGPPSTSDDDARITPVGHLLRRLKLDELPQLINVVRGEMSLVGPRPEILTETKRYERRERLLLTVRPGITDYSSIVFSNEGEILRGSEDPHEAYQRLIRPGKVALGLHYVQTMSAWGDFRILLLTALAIVAPEWARAAVHRVVAKASSAA